MLERLDDSGWRAFRLLLRELPDTELAAVLQQAEREMIHRRECDSSCVRLFFSSLCAVDLQRADAEIRYQRSEREEFLRRLEEQQLRTPPRRKKPPRRAQRPSG